MSGLRQQLTAVAQERAEQERQQASEQREQMKRLLRSGSDMPPKYANSNPIQSIFANHVCSDVFCRRRLTNYYYYFFFWGGGLVSYLNSK